MAKYRITTEDGTYEVTTEDSTPPKQPSTLSRMASEASRIAQADQSPLNTINKLVEEGRGLAAKAGEWGATKDTELNPRASNPYAAAAAGTLVGMAPDLAMTIDPLGKVPRPSKQASGAAAMASGANKGMAKTRFGRAKIVNAGRAALEEGLIPRSGSAQGFDDAVRAKAGQIGSEVGQMREAAGQTTQEPFRKAIEQTRSRILNGAEGKQGLYKQANDKVDELLATLDDITGTSSPDVATGFVTPKKIGLNRVVEAKNRFAGTLNWFADNTSQKDAKSLAMALEEGVSTAMKASGADMNRYKKLKTLYSNLKTLSKGLDDRLAGEAVNSPVSFRAMMFGSGAGSLPAQLAQTGAAEFVKRRGAGIAANTL